MSAEITSLEKRYEELKRRYEELRIKYNNLWMHTPGIYVARSFNDVPLSSFCSTYITKVIYQNPATIVFWSDGTKTVAKCDESDTFDEEKGLILCIMKKVFPNKNIGTLLGMWTSGSADTYGKNIIKLKQARKMEKEFSVYWNAITGKKEGEN